jgi:hypothetical protein
MVATTRNAGHERDRGKQAPLTSPQTPLRYSTQVHCPTDCTMEQY